MGPLCFRYTRPVLVAAECVLLTRHVLAVVCAQHHRASQFTYFFASGTPPCDSVADCSLIVATDAAPIASETVPLQFAAEAVEGIALPVLGPKDTRSLVATTILCTKFAAAANYAMQEAELWGYRPTPPRPTRASPNCARVGNSASEVVETVEVQEGMGQTEAGRYTAFADGSVHVAFFDRTMISLQSLSDTRPGHDRVEVLLPDGSRRSFPLCAAPTGGLLGDIREGRIGLHLAAAVEFQQWACATPAERIQAAMREQARKMVIQGEVAKTQRFLDVQTMQRNPVDSEQLAQAHINSPSGDAALFASSGDRFVQELRSRPGREGLDLSGLLARNRETIAEIHKLVG